jgi:hypothetical protein
VDAAVWQQPLRQCMNQTASVAVPLNALSSAMAMYYTGWYTQILKSLPERRGAPFRAPRLI